MRCVQIQADVLSITHLGRRTLNPLVSSVRLRTRTVIDRSLPMSEDRRAVGAQCSQGPQRIVTVLEPGQVGPLVHPRPHRILP